jgi:hypothetical protein
MAPISVDRVIDVVGADVAPFRHRIPALKGNVKIPVDDAGGHKLMVCLVDELVGNFKPETRAG